MTPFNLQISFHRNLMLSKAYGIEPIMIFANFNIKGNATENMSTLKIDGMIFFIHTMYTQFWKTNTNTIIIR